MKRFLMILVALMVSVGVGFAQAQKNVAVATFDVVGNVVSQEEAEAITELYITELVTTGKVTIFDRKNFDKILAEMKFQSGDWASSEKTVQLQKATGATVLGRGQIFKLGSSFYINATMIDANTAQILSASKKQFSSIDDVFNILGPMAKEITTAISKVVMKYKIGDTGPGGGIVFYVSEEGFEVFDGKGGVQKCNYLEVTKEQLADVRWCPCSNGCSIQGATGLGYGKSNTYKIVTSHSSANSGNCAAYVCYKYSSPTTSTGEWFLPSKDELSLIYKNVGAKIMAGASEAWHWSSSPYNNDAAWVQSFSDGSQDGGYKNYAHCVRAVRAFSN